jgi:hypothetical protein
VAGGKLVGLVLLIAGILAIAFGGFSFTKDETEAKLGPLKVEIQEKEHVNVPLWAGLAVSGLGAVLLLRRA